MSSGFKSLSLSLSLTGEREGEANLKCNFLSYFIPLRLFKSHTHLQTRQTSTYIERQAETPSPPACLPACIYCPSLSRIGSTKVGSFRKRIDGSSPPESLSSASHIRSSCGLGSYREPPKGWGWGWGCRVWLVRGELGDGPFLSALQCLRQLSLHRERVQLPPQWPPRSPLHPLPLAAPPLQLGQVLLFIISLFVN